MISKPHATDGPYWNLRGNGGMLSTVDDMHAFYKALFETNKLLKPETRALRFNPNEPIGLAGSDLVSSFLYDRTAGRRHRDHHRDEFVGRSLHAGADAIGQVLGFRRPTADP